MPRASRLTARSLRLALAAATLLCAPAARAQFPITESFKNATAPGWSLLGNATLTSGGIDPTGSGWLRLTDSTNDQAGSAIYNTAFPSSSGIAITFDYADYGGTGADGFSFYLINGATASPQVGSSGGPLGYAAKYSNTTCASGTETVTIPGVTNGYVGIGFDEYGNFSACESGLASPGRTPQSVVIRGSGTRVAVGATQAAFRYLTGVTVASSGAATAIDGVGRTTPRHARVSIVNQKISVALDFGSGYQSLISAYDLATAVGQTTLPATFKMGLSGSTGGSTNIHEIRNVLVSLPANLTLGQTVAPSTVSVTGTVTFTITIANDATNAAPNSLLTDAFPAGLSNVAWTVATAGGATVARASGTGNLNESVSLPKNGSITYTVTATVTAAAAGQILANTVTLLPPPGVANLLTNTASTSLTVSKMASAIALGSSANPSVFGQPVTLTATVSAVAPGSGTPTGTVTFLDGATTLGSVALSGGVATFSSSALVVGSHPITASYGGASNFGASGPASLTQVVNQADTVVALGSSANPSVFGQAVTFTATVSADPPGAGTPTGTVTFKDGATTLGTGALSGGVATFSTSALVVGSHAITASYGGATSFDTSVSPTLTQVVAKASTTAGVVSGANPSRVGQSITLTAAVAVTAPGAGTPTGTVTFLDGATVLGTAPLSGGAAILATSALALGSHTVTVAYSGDGSFAAATSLALTQVVNAAATTTGLVASINPTVFGQSVTFTATIAVTTPGGGTPTGTVGFYDGAVSLGTGNLSGGVATFSTSALAVGSHSITAVYGGTPSYTGSTSAALVQVVNKATPAVALASSANPSTYGASVTFTATLSGAGATPTGTVTFLDGATPLCSNVTAVAGVATCSIATLVVGSHPVTASYGGDASYLTATSAALSQTVNKATPAVALTSSANPSTYGTSVTFTATLSGPGATPTGTVTFLDGATPLCSAVTAVGGVATCSIATLAVGSHPVTASYGGDASYLTATSAALSQTVNKATPAVALTSSANPSTYGASVTFTATLSGPGATPTGTVTFLDGATTLGTGTLSGGVATFSTSALAVGSHPVTASFGGDSSYLVATSAALSQTVNKATPAVALASSANPSTYGASVTFTATLSGPGATPTGTVTFLDGVTPLCSNVTVTAGVATCSIANLVVGSHPVTASYGGDASYLVATSAALSQTVNKATPAVALASSANPSTYGASVTFTATLSGPGAIPTGTVTFLDGVTPLCSAVTAVGGVATCSIATLAVGSHPVTANYAGSSSYLTATSAALSQTVNKATPAVALASSANPSSYGVGVTFTATLSGPGATPTGTVTFLDGVTPLCSNVTVTAGVATCSIATLAVGSHPVTASYAGSSSYLTATSAALSQTVNKATPAVALASSANPSSYGASVTFTATLSGPGANPTGTVTFLDGVTPLCSNVTVAAGVATCSTATLAVASHPITASYGGDSSYLTATSLALTQVVNAAATTTALVASTNPTLFGQSVTFTATIAVTAPGGGTPTGTVGFYDGAVSLGTGTLSGLVATFSTAALSVGSHSITAVYGGTSSYTGSTSAAVAQVVNKAATTTTLAAATGTFVTGQLRTFTATVGATAPGAGTPTGTVTFSEGATVLGSASLSGGVATLAIALPAGVHTIAASYGGSASFLSSSGTTSAPVSPAATATALVAAPSPALFGEAVLLTATVTATGPGAGTPTGTVTFSEGATVLGSASLSGGVATLSTSSLAVGAHPITASYGVSASFSGSTSPPTSVSVVPAPTTTTLASSLLTVTFGDPLTLTATVAVVSPGAGTPGGTVRFFSDAVALGDATLDGTGHAVLPVSGGALLAGAHSLTATYLGTASFGTSTSATVTESVARAATTTAVSSGANPSVRGQDVTFTATVSVPAGLPAATGTVTFNEGATVLGTGTVVGGVATFSTGALAPGPHTITASFGGDADYAGSTSPGLTQQVNRAATATALATSSNPSGFGSSVTFTATVTAQPPGAGTPTGTVTFLDGAATLGTGTLSGGIASFGTSALVGGTYSITARYEGDAGFLTSTSLPLSQVVGIAPTTLALATSKSPTVFGELAMLTATVTATAGTPTGPVTFKEGGTTLGTAALVVGVATLPVASLSVGSHTLTASYAATTDFGPSAGSTGQEVAKASTDVVLMPSPSPAVTGQPVTISVAVTARAPGAGTPSGPVQILVDEVSVGPVTLTGGVASLILSDLAPGPHALTAVYAGDASFLGGATAAPAPLSIEPAATATALAASSPASVFGEPVTFTATVTVLLPGAGLPTGTVTFSGGTTTLGTAPLDPSGRATLDVATLPVGGHDVVATYGGDPAFALSISDPVHHDVAIATATAALVAAPSTSVLGQPVAITVSVGPGSSSTATPGGSVRIMDGATVLATVSLVGGTTVVTSSDLAVGSHALRAAYLGDAGFAPATSAPFTQTVAQAATTTTLAATPAPSVAGEPVHLSATVVAVFPGAGTPSGTVEFLDGGVSLGTGALDASGLATLDAPLAVGPHGLTARYGGDPSFLSSTSAPLDQAVIPGDSTTSLSASLSPSTFGQEVTFTATVAAVAPAVASPSGTVVFTVDGAVAGSIPLAGGTATFTTSALPGGSHVVGAAYSGDSSLNPSASAPLIQLVTAAPVALALVPAPLAPVAGQQVVLTATASSTGGVPGGLVTFLDGTTSLGTVALDPSGVATLTLPAGLPVGHHPALSAILPSSTSFETATAFAALEVAQAATATTLAAAPSASSFGQPVVLTAVVSVLTPGAGTPTGTVTFAEGGQVLGTAPVDGSGQATLTTSAFPVGTHPVTAAYGGDASLGASSGATSVTVGAAPTATTVAASPTSSTFGQPVTFAATVSVQAPGAGAPSGTVTFREGSTVLDTLAIDASGRAALTTSALAVGAHTVSATYSGDPSFQGSSAATPAAVQVGLASTSVALTASPSPARVGDPVTLTAHLTSPAGAPGGTVTFLDGTQVLGTGTVDASGTATLTVSTLGGSTHTITAQYGGDATHLPGSGSTSLEVARVTATVAVVSSRNPSRAGRPVTFTATVAASGGTPGGSVTFKDGSGATPVVLGTATLVEGQAAFTTRDLVKGTHPITVDFAGDATYAPASGTLQGGEVVENSPPVAGSGMALSFGGASTLVNAWLVTIDASSGSLDRPQGTVELWAHATGAPSGLGPAATLARLGGATTPRWQLALAPDQRGVVVTLGGSSTTVPAAFDDGAWHHLALVGGPASSTLFLDGLEAGALAEPFADAPADSLTLGGALIGELDELRVWSTARSAADLRADARRPLTGAEPGLAGLWRFDEGSGLEVFDASPSHLDGVITLVDPAATAPAHFVASQAWRHRRAVADHPMAPVDAGYDPDGDPLTLSITSPPAHGDASTDAAHLQLGYQSHLGFSGEDPFTFQLGDGTATSGYTLAVAVEAAPSCQSVADCGAGDLCFQGACVPGHAVDVRSGGCGCTSGGGEALALWSLLALALTGRRRTRRAVAGRLP